MYRLTQSLLMAAIGIAFAAMLLDMLARGVFGPGSPAEPIDDAPTAALTHTFESHNGTISTGVRRFRYSC
jgi:hypothetical protein